MPNARAFAATASIVAALFLLPLTATAPLGAAGPVRLTIGVIGPIGSLDPATASGAVAREVWRLQYPTLTTFAPRARTMLVVEGQVSEGQRISSPGFRSRAQ